MVISDKQNGLLGNISNQMTLRLQVVVAALLLVLLIQPFAEAANDGSNSKAKKNVLLIDSYHRGYRWSDSVVSGILTVFNAKLNANDTIDDSRSTVALKLIRMDTKRNNRISDINKAALEVNVIIKSWKPDLVIASDDNASRYVVVPYLRNTTIPVVFCGVNYDAAVYGFPCKNITGMIEVDLFPEMLKTVAKYAKGKRVAFLAPDRLTNRKIEQYLKKRSPYPVVQSVFVKSYMEWKKAFRQLQQEVDMLVMTNHSGLADFNVKDATEWCLTYTEIPAVATLQWMIPYVVLCFSKDPQEQGRWAARTAMRILNGESPVDIPTAENKDCITFLNMRIAKKLGIKFPVSLIEKANLVDSQKLLNDKTELNK